MFNWAKKNNETATLGDVFMYVMTCYGVLFGAFAAFEHREEIGEFVKGGIEKVKEKKLKLTKK